MSEFNYVKTIRFYEFFLFLNFVQKDFLESGYDEISAWFSDIGKNEADLLRTILVKNITGEDIKQIIDVFAPLIGGLIKKSGDKKNDNKKNHINPYSSEAKKVERRRKKGEGKLPPGWKEVLAPAGNTFYFNTKTGTTELDPPEMCVSDTPYIESTENIKRKPSALDIFQRMPPNFYETLDKAFETAAFTDLADIRASSQEKVEFIEEYDALNSLGINREEAEVLFSYTYEAKENKKSPYFIMNKILTEKDNNKINSHCGYILHLLKALRKLKPIPVGTTLYRGIDGKFLKFDDDHYKVGNTLTWPAFTSTTLEEDVIYSQFLKRAAQPIIFEIHGSFVGYNIMLFSRFPNEKEILLEPETTFQILSIENDAKNPKAKRIMIYVQSTPLIIDKAVENFTRNDLNYQQWKMNGNRGYGQQHMNMNYGGNQFANNYNNIGLYQQQQQQQINSFNNHNKGHYQQQLNMNNNGGQFMNNFNNAHGQQQQMNMNLNRIGYDRQQQINANNNNVNKFMNNFNNNNGQYQPQQQQQTSYNNSGNKFGQTNFNQNYNGNQNWGYK